MALKKVLRRGGDKRSGGVTRTSIEVAIERERGKKEI